MPDKPALRDRIRGHLTGFRPRPFGQQLPGPIALLLLALAIAGGIALLIGSYPGKLPAKTDPGFVDNIFNSRFVVFVARLALVALGIYVIASLGALIWNRKWLTQVGPGGVKVADVSQSVAEYERQNLILSRDLADAGETIDDLQDRLRESDSALEETQRDIELLLRHVDKLESSQRET